MSYSDDPLVTVAEACEYCRIDDTETEADLIASLVLAATGACQHEVGREGLYEGDTDDGEFDAITETQAEQIKLWIKAQVAYWYENRSAAGATELKIQPAFHYLIDSVREYE